MLWLNPYDWVMEIARHGVLSMKWINLGTKDPNALNSFTMPPICQVVGSNPDMSLFISAKIVTPCFYSWAIRHWS